jgi:hypothetical protein
MEEREFREAVIERLDRIAGLLTGLTDTSASYLGSIESNVSTMQSDLRDVAEAVAGAES